MPPAPLFSVVTVCRDNLVGLRKTFASLQYQTFKDDEWIVIDGGSQDGTKDFLQGTPAIWASEPDNGIYDAMNKGLGRASGKYILFLNAGDRLAGDGVLDTIKPYAEQETALIYGDSFEEENGAVFYKPSREAGSLKLGLFTHHQAMFYNRAALGSMRYDTRYAIAADYDLTARLLILHPSAVYCPVPICIFESGGVSQQNSMRGRKEQFQIRKTLKLCSGPLNYFIYGAQAFAWVFRMTFPNLYWSLKSRILR